MAESLDRAAQHSFTPPRDARDVRDVNVLPPLRDHSTPLGLDVDCCCGRPDCKLVQHIDVLLRAAAESGQVR